jgi:hypothetical protein
MVGSAEPMSDKQCRYSQVRILESSAARAVVHWGYAPIGVGYRPAYPDPLVALVVKGWGDGGASLTLDGREVASGKDFRVGHRRRL